MVKYNVSADGKRIDAFPRGILQIKDAMDYFRRLSEDKNIEQGAVEIVHFKDVTDFKMSYSEMGTIAEGFQIPKSVQKINQTIFVCETTVAYGIGRMLQTLNEITNPESNIIIARTEDELENLLKEA